MKKLLLTFAGIVVAASVVMAQGDLSNQVLRLLSRINTWSALQTYTAGSGIILLGRQSVPLGTRTDRLENIGGNLYFNGVLLESSEASGTVTSVDMTVPSIMSVSGNPITSSGTLAVSLATQSANTVWAGPTSGGAATPAFRAIIPDDFSTQTANTGLFGPTTGSAAKPTFRAIVNADLPTSGVSAGTYPKVTVNTAGIVTAASSQISLTADVSGTLPLANGGTGLTSAANNAFIIGNGTAWTSVTAPSCGAGFLSYTTGNHFECNAAFTSAPSTDISNNIYTLLDFTLTPTANQSGDFRRLAEAFTLAGSRNFSGVNIGTGVGITVNSTGSVNNATGFQALGFQTGAATTTGLYGGDIETFVSAGSVDFQTGLYVYADSNGGTLNNSTVLYVDGSYNTPTITNRYGIYLEDQTIADTTLDYAIFYNGPSEWSIAADGTEVVPSIFLGSSSGPSITADTGAPMGACTVGSIYSRTDGGAGSSIYFCNNSSWAAFSTSVSGIVGAANGGTGFDGSSAANGRLPIGNGTGFTLANLTGTSNQITVTNGAGTITLSTPQSIGTSSTPRFARLGLGTGAGATAVITTTGTIDTGYYNAGNSGTALTIDWLNGMAQKTTLTDNCTFTINNPIAGTTYTFVLIQDGTGSRTVTWPGSITWQGGAAPTLTTTAGKADIIYLFYNGSAYYGRSSLNY